MKNGKKPTVVQKKRIASYKLDPNEWLVVKDCSIEFLIQNRITGVTLNYQN